MCERFVNSRGVTHEQIELIEHARRVAQCIDGKVRRVADYADHPVMITAAPRRGEGFAHKPQRPDQSPGGLKTSGKMLAISLSRG